VTGALLPLQMLPGYFATQLDIITSHTVALKVVDQLDLTALRLSFGKTIILRFCQEKSVPLKCR
jgi:uncharacterized protein involved in exopolysaccharide biosynthesis